jgi:tRNA(Ile)-lysidine synthase
MPSVVQSALAYIRSRRLIAAGDRVGVAVSGGADSVALLRILLELRSELGCVLSVVHFNHRIRGKQSDEDAEFVASLAAAQGIQLHSDSADTPAVARERRLGLEAAGRQLRYDFFRRLIASGELDKVATAHTLDDQAETVLLRVLRGAWTRGLASIHPARQADSSESGSADGHEIIRPLLALRRSDLVTYLNQLGQAWREDESNQDVSFARNKVRHELLPLLEREYNPQVASVLASTAEIARAEEQYWASEIARLLQTGLRENAFRVDWLVTQPLAVQRRLIYAAAEKLGGNLDFEHVERVLAALAETDSNVELPADMRVHVNGRELRFSGGRLSQQELSTNSVRNSNYEYRVSVPGEVVVPELGARIKVISVASRTEKLTSDPELPDYNASQLLSRRAVGSELVIRNWRPGDRYWPAHSRAPEKVKRLLQERRIRLPQRSLWPVAACGERIIWMRGFPPPADLLAADREEAVAIAEEPAG